MSSSRKRAYKHKAYAEIDHLKQKLMMVEHHYKVMEAMARKAAGMVDDHKACLIELKGVFGDLINHKHKPDVIQLWSDEAIIKIDEALK